MGFFNGILNIGSGFIDSAVNLFNNERNLDYQKENLRYHKQLQQQIFQREDTAVQRRAADLAAAGMNPLLAAGGAASSGQAVQTSAPQSNLKFNFADTAMMLHRMRIDNSMTKAQQELLRENANIASKQSQLLDLQIDWYKNHPEYAPNAPVIESRFDRASNRLGSSIGEFFGHRVAARNAPNPKFNSLVRYYMDTGSSPSEATRRARNFLNKVYR